MELFLLFHFFVNSCISKKEEKNLFVLHLRKEQKRQRESCTTISRPIHKIGWTNCWVLIVAIFSMNSSQNIAKTHFQEPTTINISHF